MCPTFWYIALPESIGWEGTSGASNLGTSEKMEQIFAFFALFGGTLPGDPIY
jgi:hypothetical protein